MSIAGIWLRRDWALMVLVAAAPLPTAELAADGGRHL